MKKSTLLITAFLCLGIITTKAQLDTLVIFKGANGNNPGSSSLTLSGNELYGMTSDGGETTSFGVLFSVKTDGAGYSDRQNFNGTNGQYPDGSLTLSASGKVLYGMTPHGGAHSFGCIFSIDTNGSGYTDLLDFTGTNGAAPGSFPVGSLILSGTVLYGMAQVGGALSNGCIFSFNTNGSVYSDLLDFNGTTGQNPSGSLTLSASGTVLYGMTTGGGAHNDGCIFSIKTNGAGYKDLMDFNGTTGRDQRGSLTLSGSVLYGTTEYGGAHNEGLIFSIDTNGSGYSDLVDFNGASAPKGANPWCTLTLSGSTLYGMTESGGQYYQGCIFSFNTNGNIYTDLLDFNNSNDANPEGSLIISGNVLYGMATVGGSNRGDGFVFSYTLPFTCNLTATASATANVSCNGGSNGNATASPSSGTSPYTYSWSNGSSTVVSTSNPTGDVLSSGTYTLTVTDAVSCTATATVTITQPTALSASCIVNSNVSSYGGINGSATANPSGGTKPYTYSWDDAETAQTATGLYASTHTVTVNDSNGCTTTASITITQPAPLCNEWQQVGSAGFSGGEAKFTSLAIDDSGTLYIAYKDYAYHHRATVMKFSGGSWKTVGSAGFSIGAALSTCLAIDRSGTPYVSYPEYSSKDGDSYQATVMKFSGGSWTTVGPPAFSSSSADQTCLVIDGSGTPYIAFQDGSTNYQVTVMKFSGSSWQTVGSAGFSAGPADYISLAIDGSGTPYVSYEDFANNEYATVMKFSGSSWQTVGSAGFSGGIVQYTSLAIDGSGTPYIGYEDFTNTANAAVMKFSGGSWQTVGSPGFSHDGAIYTSLAIDHSGTPYIAYQDGYNNSHATVMKFSGGSWQPVGSAAFSPGHVAFTSLAINGSGTPYVAYLDAANSQKASVMEFISLNVNVTTTGVSCYGGSNGSATASVGNGKPPYTYSWSNGSSTAISTSNQTGTVLSAGTYTLTVTDSANACTALTSVTITQPATALIGTAAVNSDVSTYGGNNGNATANPSGGTSPYTYSWDDAETAQTAVSLNAGTHTLTLTDAHSCTATAAVTITQPTGVPLFANALVTANVSCNGGNSGSAALNTSGGAAPYTYSWSNAVAKDSATGLTAGIYTVTVTDNASNTATASVTITQPASAVVISMASHTNGLCNTGGSATANIATGGTPFSAINTVVGNHAAGYGYSGDGGPATSAEIFGPAGVAFDGSGNMFISDYYYNVIREVNHSTGDISTVAGTGNHTAGAGYSGDGGPATSAELDTPIGIAIDGSGNIYIADQENNVIREVIHSTGNISTIAGIYAAGGRKYSGDGGPATSAELFLPAAVALDDSGNIFIADAANDAIREINHSTGNISTIAGNGYNAAKFPPQGGYSGNGGAATSAELNFPAAITLDGSGNIFIADQANQVIREVIHSTGNINTVAGNNVFSYSGDGGPATSAELEAPNGVAVDGSGNIFISDFSNSLIREVTHSKGIITTVAGNHTAGQGYSGDGAPATSAELNRPAGIALDASGDIFFADEDNGLVREVSPTGYYYTWTPGGGTKLTASNLSAGTYTITATDAHGCTATASASITQAAPLGITLLSHTNILCNEGTASATANAATGGTSPYTYSWTAAGGTNLAASNLNAGIYTITATDNSGCNATASVSITQPAAIRDSVASLTYLCASPRTGTATIGIKGGVTPYTYSWTPNVSSTGIASGLTTRSYTVNVKDNNGCTSSVTFSVTQPLALRDSIVKASTVNILCYGGINGSAIAGVKYGIAPYTYSWSNATASATATGLSVGTYSVTITDNNGCNATAGVSITQPKTLRDSVAGQTNIICHGTSSGAVSIGVALGANPFTFSWSPTGKTNQIASGLSAGGYTVTVSNNNGCSNTLGVTITQPVILSVSANITANITCHGESNGSVSATPSGGTLPYTYSWSGGGTNSTKTGLSAGTYTITLKDKCGANATASTTITQPVAIRDSIVTASIVNILCNGAKTGSAKVGVKYGTSPYTYSWAPSGGNSSTASGLSAGNYNVTVTDNNGCNATASLSITQPALLAITMSSHVNILCDGSSTGNATANAATGGVSPYTYSWSSGGSTNLSVSNLGAGTYTITATDKNGCTAKASISITQPLRALKDSVVVQTNELCNGASTAAVSIGVALGDNPFTFLWSPTGKTNALVSGLSAGIYTVTITNNNGCSNTLPVTITQPAVIRDSIVTFGCDSLTTGGIATLGVKGGTVPYTYKWSPGAGTSATMTGLSNGTYTITVKDKNGCTGSTLTQKISCVATVPPRNGENNQNPECCPDNVNLYPNPNTGQFTISGIEKGMIIETYDYTGRRISSSTATDNNMQFNLSTKANGMYLIRIISKDGTLVSQKKVVKTQ